MTAEQLYAGGVHVRQYSRYKIDCLGAIYTYAKWLGRGLRDERKMGRGARGNNLKASSRAN